ncbi:hypothetical protein GW17_00019605 [Ensete ventricosum]|nr:hypothetical protein GW17_00019605 [Ensete ventricosum]RZR93746.1 hypothetical protein BHM03_00022319 [Ensete ventricosum]
MEGPDPEAHGEGGKKEGYWEVIRTWLRLHRDKSMSGTPSSTPFHARSASKRTTDLRLILGVLGCPLAPIPLAIDAPTHLFCLKDSPMVMHLSICNLSSPEFADQLFSSMAGNLLSSLHHSAVPGRHRMPETVHEEHVRSWDREDGLPCATENRGRARVLRAVAEVAGDVVGGACGGRPQGGFRLQRQGGVEERAMAWNTRSQGPAAPAPATRSGERLCFLLCFHATNILRPNSVCSFMSRFLR